MAAKKAFGNIKAASAQKSENASNVTKAELARDLAVKGKQIHKKKVYKKPVFTRPKTLKLARKPKYPQTSVQHRPRFDAYKILIKPINTESAMKSIEENNTLVYQVDIKANKHQIKEAMKTMHQVDAVRINTLISARGIKKAFIKLHPDADALDVANKIGYV